MAITRRPNTKPRGQPIENFAAKCGELLRGMEQQKALAREMIETARRMCDRAAEMRKAPHIIRPGEFFSTRRAANGAIAAVSDGGQE